MKAATERDVEYALALSTFPDEQTARRVGRDLVESKLAACVNIVPAISSIYVWQGKVEEGQEVLAIFKLTQERFAEFQARLQELHPYDVPEIIRIAITGGSADYLRWLAESCAR